MSNEIPVALLGKGIFTKADTYLTMYDRDGKLVLNLVIVAPPMAGKTVLSKNIIAQLKQFNKRVVIFDISSDEWDLLDYLNPYSNEVPAEIRGNEPFVKTIHHIYVPISEVSNPLYWSTLGFASGFTSKILATWAVKENIHGNDINEFIKFFERFPSNYKELDDFNNFYMLNIKFTLDSKVKSPILSRLVYLRDIGFFDRREYSFEIEDAIHMMRETDLTLIKLTESREKARFVVGLLLDRLTQKFRAESKYGKSDLLDFLFVYEEADLLAPNKSATDIPSMSSIKIDEFIRKHQKHGSANILITQTISSLNQNVFYGCNDKILGKCKELEKTWDLRINPDEGVRQFLYERGGKSDIIFNATDCFTRLPF